MVLYHRNGIANKVYFFTVTLREAVQRTKIEKSFAIDADYSAHWRSIKAYFSYKPAKLFENPQRNAKDEYGSGSVAFGEHTLCDTSDFSHHIDYTHYNLVKHGYV